MGIFKKITSFFKDDKRKITSKDNSEESNELIQSISSDIKPEILKKPKLKTKQETETKKENKQLLKPKTETEIVSENIFSSNTRLDMGLKKTKNSFFSKLGKVLIGKSKVDDDVLDDLEEVLITSDVGVETTIKIIKNIEKRVSKDKFFGSKELKSILKDEIAGILTGKHSDDRYDFELPLNDNPFVIMVVGVNGVGKTTTIGKLANKYKLLGKKVMLGASDTFRAGAIDQLQVWADRVDVKLVKQSMGSDPASVAFDTLKSAKSQKIDVVIIDTAGRLHNKVNLMNELTKIKRVMNKVIPSSPHEVLLVLDGSTGQNAFEQAKKFSSAADVTSLAITKLDGTAKGGVVIGISNQFKIPVKYIGVGEKIDDLQVFNPKSFVDSFFG